MPKYKHGSGSVYPRGKTWWIAYYGPDGKLVCESAKTKDKAEARRILQTKLGQIADGRDIGPAADRVTFEELIEGLLTDYRVNSKKSLRVVKVRVDKHSCPSLAGSRLTRSLRLTCRCSWINGKGQARATRKSTAS
jgi:hypothetical protein